jgi:Nitrate and nitrite sensing/HAMP domain
VHLQSPTRTPPSQAAAPAAGASGTKLLRPRNWPLRSKLVAVLAIPAVAFVVVAGVSIASSLENARSLRSGGELAALEGPATALVHELQLERDQVASAMTRQRQAGGAALTKALAEQQAAQQAAVDRAVADYLRAEERRQQSASPRIRAQLDTARSRLGTLRSLRAATRSAALTEGAVFEEYTRIIASLLDVDLQTELRGGDDQLTQGVRTFTDLARAKELTAQVRGSLYAIATRERFGFGEFQDFADLLAQQRASLDQFQADANDQQRSLLSDVVKGQAVLAVARIEQTAVNRQAQQDLNLDPQQWMAASTTQIELMRSVESQLLDQVTRHSRELGDSAQLRSAVSSGLIALILAVSLLTSLAIGRSMVRPLQRLRSSALEVAEHRLPEAVQRLRMTRQGEPQVEVVAIGDASADEIGEVARAFDVVHNAAIRQATEQAALRKSISDMFLNLARRSQRLIDRLLEQLDELEREADDETLERLFSADHLVTRLRRNAEDLIVLSGAEPPRRWARPIPLMEVVRAAAQEVEQYQRIEVLPVDEIDLAGHAVADVVHLLAELVENATSFSPPGTVVQIAGQPAAAGYVVEIEDRGLGMSDEELVEANRRLADPPAIDAAVSQRLGLFVVGRLAKRHGIKVQLRHSWYGGVTALVLLPSALTIPTSDHERLLPGRTETLPPAAPSTPRHASTPPAGPMFDPYPDGGDEHDHIAGP